jgi:hypothetical protein
MGVFDYVPAQTTELAKWWLKGLQGVWLPDGAIAELAGLFDCDKYTREQARVCACLPPPVQAQAQDAASPAPPRATLSGTRAATGGMALGGMEEACRRILTWTMWPEISSP